MATLTIRIERNLDIAREILKNYQYIIFARIQRGLYNILVKAPKKRSDRYKIGEYSSYFIEEGAREYIELEKKKFEFFMFSDHSELKKRDSYREYQRYTNDRWVNRVLAKAHKAKKKVSDGLMRRVMGDNTIQGWFAKLGIFIRWEVDLDG